MKILPALLAGLLGASALQAAPTTPSHTGHEFSVDSVPEPQSLALIVGGVGLILLLRRRGG